MSKDQVTLVLRSLALAGLLAFNWMLPVQASETCWSCLQNTCLPLISGGGHTYCQTHENHCDEAGPCMAG